MTEENNDTESTPTPPPLPGQVFIRPGIDDHPDFDKVLSPEEKSAIARLTVKQTPRKPQSSNEKPEVQAARLNAAGSPVTAAASIDVAVPNMESSFLDLRDPMVDADGYRPSRGEVAHMKIGFMLAALFITIPWAALNVVLVPVRIAVVAGEGRTMSLATLMGVGVVASVLCNALISQKSDNTRTSFGRRTPWIISGGLIAGLFTLLLGAGQVAFMTVCWVLLQLGYIMMAIPLASAFGERIPDKFRDKADAWRGVGLALGQLLGVIFGALSANDSAAAFPHYAVAFAISGILSVLVLPRERSSEEIAVRRKTEFFAAYRLPKNAPKFTFACVSRMMMMAAVALTGVFQWYIVAYYIVDAMSGLAATVVTVCMMAVASFVASLIGAFVLGPIVWHFDDLRIPTIAACVLYALGLMGVWAMPSTSAMVTFAALGGFAFALFDGVGQSMAMSVLPDVRESGRYVGVMQFAGSVGMLIGIVAGAALMSTTGASYAVLLLAAVVAVVLSGLAAIAVRA